MGRKWTQQEVSTGQQLPLLPKGNARMDWTYNTIWMDKLPAGRLATIEFQRGRALSASVNGATYYRIHKFKTKEPGFHGLNGVTSAEYLEVNFSNITSFLEIRKLGKVKRLELSWCLKLENDSGLSEIGEHLEWLHMDTSRKFSPKKDLFELSNLKVLCLNGCAPLASLRFLESMPNLLDFRFVDTNILDGDLTPLLNHPNLKNAGFLDKRHYNLKSIDVDNHFRERKEKAIEYAYKGNFQTFRYKAFDAKGDA